MPKKRQRHTLKDKHAKKLLIDFKKRLGIDLEQFFGTNARIEVDETETAKIFIIDGRPLLVKSDETLFFTLFFGEVFSLLPKIVVDMGAVPYVCKGADIMAPGVVSIDGDFDSNNLLIIVDERHRKPLALGVALYNSKEMRILSRGKIIKILHYVGDNLWNLIKTY